MDVFQFRSEIIRPTLTAIHLWSPAAEQLLLGTAVHESSGLRYVRQLPRIKDGKQVQGPARGFYQIEPETAEEIIKRRMFGDKSILGDRFRTVTMFGPGDDLNARLVGDMIFGTVIARLKYWDAQAPLPLAGDMPAMARYWWLHYHGDVGPNKERDFLNSYERWVRP